MKKKTAAKLIAVLLAAALLCGCASPEEFYREVKDGSFSLSDTFGDLKAGISDLLGGLSGRESDPWADLRAKREENIVAFADMEYVRPDIDKLSDDIEAVEDALDEGKMRVGEIMELLDVCFEDYYTFDTMYCLANIRNCIDLKDTFYADEYEWCGEQGSVVDDLIDELYYACGGSKYAMKLEKRYFWEGFAEEYANEEDSIYTDELVALMQQESDLITEYRDLIAEPTINLFGEEISFSDTLDEVTTGLLAAIDSYFADPTAETYNDYLELYEIYQAILEEYYTKYGELEGELFLKLVRVRNAMAEEAGFDSYEQMQYEFSYERDYTPEDAEKFIGNVEKYILPLKDKLLDMESDGEESEAGEPDVSDAGLKKCLSAVVDGMGGTFADSYRFMLDYDLYDFSDGPNKTPMSFQTYLNDYEAPFLLISPEGSYNDILTAVHEFGHYTDSYGNFGASETMDLAECFSQGLELLSLDLLEDTVGSEGVRSMGIGKISDLISVYQQQCAFAEFEHEVYAIPEKELSLEKVNAIAEELGLRFGFMTGEEGLAGSRYWIDIPHFFEQAFYVISYPVSNVVALQLYGLELENEGDGIAKYNEMLQHSSGDLLETLEEYGMDSPFERSSVKQAAKTIELFAEKYQ